MEHGLQAGLEQSRAEVGISVAAQQHQLEEKHAGGPDGRTSAKPRQDEFRDQRLDQEQQEGSSEDRRGKLRHCSISISTLNPLAIVRQIASSSANDTSNTSYAQRSH